MLVDWLRVIMRPIHLDPPKPYEVEEKTDWVFSTPLPDGHQWREWFCVPWIEG